MNLETPALPFFLMGASEEWVVGELLIEAYSQYNKHHSDLLTPKSLNFLPYDIGRIWAYIF